ncbi:MAG: 4Fe-4S binding protein [Methanomicrobium sp.]|nr:4Fe-4S binding protein [Methanomicrobium sp.]MBR6011055.1 4Fe-4S binding protein [Methanomicrobium sp.]MBR6447879.1 4Fe-4S binding protein [Methanomicrobium sp.]MBR6497597.1 4Fe-4S binding protein [Methanomicrobium sp.]
MIKVRREVCGYCGACVSVCPEGAIELIDAYLSIDDEICKNCRICVKVCPLGSLEAIKE